MGRKRVSPEEEIAALEQRTEEKKRKMEFESICKTLKQCPWVMHEVRELLAKRTKPQARAGKASASSSSAVQETDSAGEIHPHPD